MCDCIAICHFRWERFTEAYDTTTIATVRLNEHSRETRRDSWFEHSAKANGIPTYCSFSISPAATIWCIHSSFAQLYSFPIITLSISKYKISAEARLPQPFTDLEERVGSRIPRLYIVPPVSSSLVLRIANTLSPNSKLSVGFGQRGTVKDGADAVLPASLAEAQTSGRSVRNDVTANGLGAILGETHAVGVGDNLVGDENGNAKLFGQTGQLAEELRHLHLALA